MVGCRYRAKNTLDYNYLYFAEKGGAKIFPETRVTTSSAPSGRLRARHASARPGFLVTPAAPSARAAS